MSRWTRDEEVKLLLTILEETDPSFDLMKLLMTTIEEKHLSIEWKKVASAFGKTRSSVQQHYNIMKGKMEPKGVPPVTADTTVAADKRRRKTITAPAAETTSVEDDSSWDEQRTEWNRVFPTIKEGQKGAGS